MILTNIIADSRPGEFSISNGSFPVIKLDEIILDPKINSIGDILAWVNKEYDKTLSKDSFIEIWESLFLGPNRVKISDRLQFQFDPVNTYMKKDNSWTALSNEPYNNEISSSDATLLYNTARNTYGFSTTGLSSVTEKLIHEAYNEDMEIITDTLLWKSKINLDEAGGQIDPYPIANAQQRFWRNLKTQILEASFTLPAKNLPTSPTLGNTVPLYAFGEYLPHNILNVHVQYSTISGKHKKLNVKLMRTKELRYTKSSIIDGVQIIWIINGEKSFIKVLWDEDLVTVASIKEAKLNSELPTENTDTLIDGGKIKYLVDDFAVVEENKPTIIDVLENDNLDINS